MQKFMLSSDYETVMELTPIIQYYLCLAGVDEPVETEHAHTSPSTSPKQEPFKTECA